MIFLNVPFLEKDKAKALGARWDSDNKKWYIEDRLDNGQFNQWKDACLKPDKPSLNDTTIQWFNILVEEELEEKGKVVLAELRMTAAKRSRTRSRSDPHETPSQDHPGNR